MPNKKIWSNDYYLIPVTSEIKNKFKFDENKPDYRAEMLFLIFLTHANWSENIFEYKYKNSTIKLKRGQLVYNRVLFSNMLNITPNGSDGVLERLHSSYGAVTVLPVKIDNVETYIITIENYDFYTPKNDTHFLCSDDEVMDELHNSSMNRRIDRIDRIKRIDSDFDFFKYYVIFKNLYPKKNNLDECKKILETFTEIEIQNTIENLKKWIKTEWLNTETKFIPQATKWLNDNQPQKEIINYVKEIQDNSKVGNLENPKDWEIWNSQGEDDPKYKNDKNYIWAGNHWDDLRKI